jgi:hypothetical protein
MQSVTHKPNVRRSRPGGALEPRQAALEAQHSSANHTHTGAPRTAAPIRVKEPADSARAK